MKSGDLYEYYQGGEYYFNCIALPIEINDSNRETMKQCSTLTARYHENTHDLTLYLINGVTFIDSDVPHVIYQAKKDCKTDLIWAREVDNFFGFVGGIYQEKRFALIR